MEKPLKYTWREIKRIIVFNECTRFKFIIQLECIYIYIYYIN